MALQKNHTWELVLQQPNMNIIYHKWVFKTKLKAYGSLQNLRLGWLQRGFHKPWN